MRRIVPMVGFATWLACPAAAQDPGEPRPQEEPGRLAAHAGAALLTQAKTAAFELGMQTQTQTVPRQRSLERMMTGLVLAVAGGRLLWYRLEDKDCREPTGPRCAWSAGAGATGLGVGALLMTVFASTPAAPSVYFEPQPGGAAVRLDLLGSSWTPNKRRQQTSDGLR